MLSRLLFVYMLNPIDYSILKFISFVDANTIAEIGDVAESVYFKKGAVIDRAGNPANHIFLINEGLVQLGINGIDGSQFNLARLGPGHTFGEVPYFLNGEVIHDATAKTNVLLQKLSRANVDHLMMHSLNFSKALMAVSSMRVQTTLAYIGDTLGMPLLARTAKQILSVSKSVNNANTVNLRQVDLAHSLGVSRVSIGKALKVLSTQQLIRIGYGKLEILSREGLVDTIYPRKPQL
ncbi:Crp/Fnr family transcriptional regulator [bacterium]|nr:Crp/Fnr family transcriptional regulator [bacterium]